MTANMTPIGIETTVGERTVTADTPRGVVADLLDEAGREAEAALVRSDAVIDVCGAGIGTTDTSLDDLFAANGQPDEAEPWCAGDNCPTIMVFGEDLIVLCVDGLARWVNNARAWVEMTGDTCGRWADDIYNSWLGGNDDELRQFAAWAAQFGYEVDVDSYIEDEVDDDSYIED